jgi:two-component system phosphate regulon sensor histidine kinase PhoR
MLSFRKKILFSDFALFVFFLAVIYWFTGTNMGVLVIGVCILTVYSIINAFAVIRFSRPIQLIIDAITPYQQGKLDYVPRIVLPKMQSDEFLKLATTLNSLNEKIQKQIETLKGQRQETEAILESLAEGVIAVDISGRLIFANAVACKMLSISEEKNLGEMLSDEPLHRKCHEIVLQALQTSEVIEQDWFDTSVKGGMFLHLFSAPLARQKGAILVLQDKTADHRLLDMGKDFIGNASHELRTPITILRGFAELLRDHKKLSAPILVDVSEKIVRTCERLEKLVKGLLTLTDIENLHDHSFYPCDLLSIVDNCQHLLKEAHPDIDISFDKGMEKAMVLADGDLLDMAIMNLLENAVRYSPAPARVHMSSRFTSDCIEFKINDLGIGIPEEALPHIFNRFYTVDKARSRKAGGAGLGLSIVKTIIEKHQGKVVVVSELGKGSSFTMTLPRMKDS